MGCHRFYYVIVQTVQLTVGVDVDTKLRYEPKYFFNFGCCWTVGE